MAVNRGITDRPSESRSPSAGSPDRRDNGVSGPPINFLDSSWTDRGRGFSASRMISVTELFGRPEN